MRFAFWISTMRLLIVAIGISMYGTSASAAPYNPKQEVSGDDTLPTLKIGEGASKLIDPNTNTNVTGLVLMGLDEPRSILATDAVVEKMHEDLLMPPSLALECPVPEPTSLSIFAVAILALATGSKGKKRRARTL